MTEQQLQEIEARCNAATPGPWASFENAIRDHQGFPLAEVQPDVDDFTSQPEKDASFIAHARTEISTLIAEVRRLRRAKKRLLDALTPGCLCPGNGWLYDWNSEHGCFPVPEEYIGRIDQCRACWEAYLDGEKT